MNVTVTGTRQVALSTEEAARIAREVIRARFGLPLRASINALGELCSSVELKHGPVEHTAITVVRPSTEADREALAVLAALT